MEVTLQYVNSRIEFIITELFDIQSKVAAELEVKEKRAQELRTEFIKRLQDKSSQIEHIEGENNDMPKKLKYGEGTICRRQRTTKNGVRRYWQGRIFHDGRQITVYANTQAECLRKMSELRNALSVPRQTQPKTAPVCTSEELPKTQALTLGKWLDEWMQEFKADKTRRRYYNDLCRYSEKLKTALGELTIKKLEPMTLQKYFNTLPRTNATAKLYGVLKDCLQRAEDFGIIKKNPMKVISKPKYRKQERRPFELKEQTAILNALPDRYKAVFFFLCSTGLRIGEFLALTPQSIDFRRKCIKVEVSQDIETHENGDTKTAAGVRKVYFADELFEKFDVNSLGTYTYNAIKKAFTKVYEALNIEGISATHSCRHTYASMLYAVGVSDKVIQKQCGHADLSTTMNIYTDILTCGDSPIYEYISKLKEVLAQHYQMR